MTSAPRVWAKNVLAFLGVTDCFEAIYTGDQFQTKEDVFKMLAGRYNPSQMLSVGDQEETDIIPARKYGISGFQVKNPQDLEDIMYIGGILAH